MNEPQHAEYVRWPTCRKCGGILIAAWPDNHLAHRIALKRAARYDGSGGADDKQ